jgi:hypothetical protein
MVRKHHQYGLLGFELNLLKLLGAFYGAFNLP